MLYVPNLTLLRCLAHQSLRETVDIKFLAPETLLERARNAGIHPQKLLQTGRIALLRGRHRWRRESRLWERPAVQPAVQMCKWQMTGC